MGPRFFNRGKPSAETEVGIKVPTASMGPRFFNRGKVLAELRNHEGTGRFNGASVFQPRKADTDTDTDADEFQASMGPRFFNRGKPGTLGGVREIGGTLQWGLGFSTEERTG